MAALPTRPEAASSTKCKMEFSSHCPERSVRMLTLKTGGSPLRIGRLMYGSQAMYPQTYRAVSPPPPACIVVKSRDFTLERIAEVRDVVVTPLPLVIWCGSP